MRNFRKKNRGAGAITMAIVLGVSSFLIAFYGSQGLTILKNFGKKNQRQRSKDLIVNGVLSKVLTDLQVATRYPDAESLQSPPCHADLGAAFNTMRYLPCDNKDKDDNYNFTLDAYLLRGAPPGYNHNTCSPVTGTATSPAPQRCDVTHPGNYRATQKTVTYPKGAFRVQAPEANYATAPNFLSPESDPIVTLTKVSPQLYSVKITFSVCEPAIIRTTVPDPNDQTAVNATRGVNWATTCPAASRVPLSYYGMFNTNTDYVQNSKGAILLPTSTPGPFDGRFVSSVSGNSTTPTSTTVTSSTLASSGSGTPTTVTSSTSTGSSSSRVFSLGVTFNLNQSGANVTGSWTDFSGNNFGTISGTASGNTATITMTHNSCTGRLTGTATRLSSSRLQIVVSGTLGAPCGAISASLTATPQ